MWVKISAISSFEICGMGRAASGREGTVSRGLRRDFLTFDP
jgi:hypothetical protein